MSKFKVGDVVRALSNSNPSRYWECVGVVISLDEDGDATVQFYGNNETMLMWDSELEKLDEV